MKWITKHAAIKTHSDIEKIDVMRVSVTSAVLIKSWEEVGVSGRIERDKSLITSL